MKLPVDIFVVLITLGVASANSSLKGSKIYNVYPTTDSHFVQVWSMGSNTRGIEVLQHPHKLRGIGKILVKGNSQNAFEAKMTSSGISFEVAVEDVDSAIEHEREENDRARRNAVKNGETISFSYYHRHAEINAYLDGLAEQYPNLVSIETRNTTQGRDLKAITISTTGGRDITKPVIIADAGIHAKEWIAPSTALYMITKLVEDITESDLVENIDWVIIPVLNPDGYEYTHTDNRFWRKTLSVTNVTSCPGVDANRNFNFMWMSVGASDDPCSDIYAGPTAFSEAETRFLRDLLARYDGRTRAYVALHSYGSFLLYPYGHTAQPTDNDAELEKVGLLMAAAIDAASLPGSQKYLVGKSGALLSTVSGASKDYAFEKGHARLSYTLELPGIGFDLPPSRIFQIAWETWQGIIVLGRYVIATSSRE